MKFNAMLCISVCLKFWFFAGAISVSGQPSSINVIPDPVSVAVKNGSFKINASTKFIMSNPNDTNSLRNVKMLQKMTGSSRVVEPSNSVLNNSIFFKVDKTIASEEGYELNVSPEHIVIRYANSGGIFYAIQTLRQLLPIELETIKSQGSITVPAVLINDAPRFEWRGINLDVARHFYPIGFMKKFIETMALYKLNKLQLHLTDDQGWRIEIKRYPDLALKGGYRSTEHYLTEEVKKYSIYGPYMFIDSTLVRENNGKKEYGGFYTQNEMKDLIGFAKDRNIDIIPEIDMPSHTGIATALYPGLLGDTKGPMCPCNEYTMEFAKNVYTEIAELFPFEYMHLGVDEVDKSGWAKSLECKKFMEEKGIAGVDKLQSYFTRQMEIFFNSKGKKIIGWDEILEGGISKTATAMYWRTWVPNNLRNIVTYGNNVIIAPTSHLYFDLQQNYLSLENVYKYEPVPDYITADQQKLIKGVQSSLWSEVIPTGKRVEYMAFPRALALAEIGWSSAVKKNWNNFSGRLNAQFKRLDALNVRYRLPGLEGFAENNLYVDKGRLEIYNPFPHNEVRYTTDGTKPGGSSQLYSAPVEVNRPTVFNIALFRPDGELNELYKAAYTAAGEYMEPLNVKPVLKGLIRKYYEGSYGTSAKIDESGLKRKEVSAGIQLPENYKAPFALKYEGYIDIKETGIYTFSLISDDGSVIKIDDKEITNNDGMHKTQLRNGQAALKKGWHKFELSFIELQGDIILDVYYALPGKRFVPVPAQDLFY